MLILSLFSMLLTGVSLLFAPTATVTLTVQVVAAGNVPGNVPLSGVALTLTQQPSGATYAPCTTDSDGRCRWQVQGLRLYEIRVTGKGVSAETAAALGHAGLRGMGVMLGPDDHVQTLFLIDNNVYIADPADPSQPYIPAAGEASRHLDVTPTLWINPTATPTPASAIAAVPAEQSGATQWAGLVLVLFLGVVALTGIVVMLMRRKAGGTA
jgi:hypothetical protein